MNLSKFVHISRNVDMQCQNVIGPIYQIRLVSLIHPLVGLREMLLNVMK